MCSALRVGCQEQSRTLYSSGGKVRDALLPVHPSYGVGGSGTPPAQITDDGSQGLRGVPRGTERRDKAVLCY